MLPYASTSFSLILTAAGPNYGEISSTLFAGAQHGSTAQSSHAAVSADLAAFGCTVQSKTQPEFRYTAELLLGGETLFSHTKRILSFPHEPFFSSISRIAFSLSLTSAFEVSAAGTSGNEAFCTAVIKVL